MRHRPAVETVPLDRAGKALSDGRAGHIDDIALMEDVDRYLVSNPELRGLGETLFT